MNKVANDQKLLSAQLGRVSSSSETCFDCVSQSSLNRGIVSRMRTASVAMVSKRNTVCCGSSILRRRNSTRSSSALPEDSGQRIVQFVPQNLAKISCLLLADQRAFIQQNHGRRTSRNRAANSWFAEITRSCCTTLRRT